MNAFGITSGSNAAPTTGTTSGASGGKKAAEGFAGVLVQVIGGTSKAGDASSGIGKPDGLTGLLGLMGGSSFPAESAAEVLDLLQKLADLLGAIPPGSPLPEELQEQLAALYVLIQNAGHANAGVQDPSGLGNLPLQPAHGGEGNRASAAPTGPMLIAALQQTLNQAAEQLRSGAMPADQAASLATPLKQALEAMQQLAAVKSPAGTVPAAERSVVRNGQELSRQPDIPQQTETATSGPAARIEIRSEVRAGVMPIRNPAAPIGTDASPAAIPVMAAEGQAAGGAAGQAEMAGPSGTVPAWTLQKYDPIAAAPSGTAASQSSLPSPVPVHQFAEQLGKYLVRQFVLIQGQGSMEAKISLAPEHLGQVDIRIQIQNGQLTAQFVAENGAARDMLETQMSQLRTALQGQGLQVEKVEVVLQSSHHSAPSFQHQQGHQGTGHHGGGSQGRSARGGYEDSAAFEAELDRNAFLREIGYGGSLNVTA